MYKAVYAVSGDDRVLIRTFLFDEDGNLANNNELDLLNVFLQNPKIVDISNLPYMPRLNTPYIDGVFMSTDEDKETPLPDKLSASDIKRFSLILDNIHRGIYAFSVNSPNGEMKAAMLLSDPSIEVDTVND